MIPNCCAVCLASSCVSISLRSNPVVGYKQLTAVCTVAVCLLTWGNCSHLLSNCLFRMRNVCLRQSFSHPVSSRCQFFSHKRLLVLRPTYVPSQKRKKKMYNTRDDCRCLSVPESQRACVLRGSWFKYLTFVLFKSRKYRKDELWKWCVLIAQIKTVQ